MSAIVTIEMTGEQQLIAALIKADEIVSDFRPVFEELSDEVFVDMQRHIERHPGPPLAASTIKRKGHSRILRDKDDLYGSFQKGGANNILRISRLEAIYGTADIKAVWHHEGRGVPKRTVIEVTGEQEAKYTRIAAENLNKQLKEIGL